MKTKIMAAFGLLVFAAALMGATRYKWGYVASCDGDCPTWGVVDGAGDLAAEDDLEVDGNIDVGGTATVAGAVTLSGALSVDSLTTSATSITDTTTLTAADCGTQLFVTAGIDTKSITLPALATVGSGCRYEFFYVGADGGALVDISPNASDGIEGTCTLAASIVTFSGTDDADIGLTKATGIQGDSITLVSGDASDWYVQACSGIWANN